MGNELPPDTRITAENLVEFSTGILIRSLDETTDRKHCASRKPSSCSEVVLVVVGNARRRRKNRDVFVFHCFSQLVCLSLEL
jgi:hypothetical protein